MYEMGGGGHTASAYSEVTNLELMLCVQSWGSRSILYGCVCVGTTTTTTTTGQPSLQYVVARSATENRMTCSYEYLSSQSVLVHVLVHLQTTLPSNKLVQFFCCKQRRWSSVSKWVHIAEYAERHVDLKDPHTYEGFCNSGRIFAGVQAFQGQTV